MRVMWPPLPPGFEILVRSDRSAANRASGLSIIHPPIERKPLAINHLAVLHDRLVDAGDGPRHRSVDGLGHCVRVFATMIQCLERRSVPSICESCGRLSGVISANV